MFNNSESDSSPFKRICVVCRIENVVQVSSGKYYCKKYEYNQEMEFLPFIKVKILATNARDVQVSIEEEWLFALVCNASKKKF